MDRTKLWVDDCRPCPDDTWDHATTFHQAIYMLERGLYIELALDHDLGCFYGLKEMTGYDIVCWLEQRQMDGFYVPTKITCQSDNPIGKAKILQTAKGMERRNQMRESA